MININTCLYNLLLLLLLLATIKQQLLVLVLRITYYVLLLLLLLLVLATYYYQLIGAQLGAISYYCQCIISSYCIDTVVLQQLLSNIITVRWWRWLSVGQYQCTISIDCIIDHRLVLVVLCVYIYAICMCISSYVYDYYMHSSSSSQLVASSIVLSSNHYYYQQLRPLLDFLRPLLRSYVRYMYFQLCIDVCMLG